MLSTEEFKTWGKDYVLFAHVTTRIEGRKYDDLLGTVGGRGFPTLVALDAEGEVISKLSGGRDLEGFTAMMSSAAQYVTINAKAEKSLDDNIFLLKHAMEMGTLDLAAAREKAAGLGELNAEQQAEVDAALLGLEINSIMQSVRSREAQAAAGKTFADMWAEGRAPADKNTKGSFFSLILAHAKAESDPDLFERALDELFKEFGGEERTAPWFEQQRQVLAELKESGPPDEVTPSGGDDAEVEDHDETE